MAQRGPKGDKGDSGTSGLTLVFNYSDANSDSPKLAFAQCPNGTSVMAGGGGAMEGLGIPFNGPVALTFSGILPTGGAYYIRAYETTSTSSSWYLFVHALCRPN